MLYPNQHKRTRTVAQSFSLIYPPYMCKYKKLLSSDVVDEILSIYTRLAEIPRTGLHSAIFLSNLINGYLYSDDDQGKSKFQPFGLHLKID